MTFDTARPVLGMIIKWECLSPRVLSESSDTWDSCGRRGGVAFCPQGVMGGRVTLKDPHCPAANDRN